MRLVLWFVIGLLGINLIALWIKYLMGQNVDWMMLYQINLMYAFIILILIIIEFTDIRLWFKRLITCRKRTSCFENDVSGEKCPFYDYCLNEKIKESEINEG
jgi:hypothetical protein